MTRENLAANETSADVDLRAAEAPDGLPIDADALFLGASRNYEAVLDHAVDTGVDRVVMNVSRLGVAGAATDAFRDRGLLQEVVQSQVSYGYELAGATSFDSDNPVYMLVDGRPILGGGLMALAESLMTTDGESHEMAGVLPAAVRMHDRYQALNHVELRARTDAPTADAGDRSRGHEFHYSSADPAADARFAFGVERGDGVDGRQDGLTEYRTLGTYCHVHAESGAFDAFVENL